MCPASPHTWGMHHQWASMSMSCDSVSYLKWICLLSHIFKYSLVNVIESLRILISFWFIFGIYKNLSFPSGHWSYLIRSPHSQHWSGFPSLTPWTGWFLLEVNSCAASWEAPLWDSSFLEPSLLGLQFFILFYLWKLDHQGKLFFGISGDTCSPLCITWQGLFLILHLFS